MNIKKVPLIALVAATSALGGQIQIGGTNGLTSSYISGNCPAGITNCLVSPAIGGTAINNPTAASLGSYNTTLFASAANGASTPNVYGVASGTLTDKSAEALSLAGAGGVQFNLINDGNSSDNAWLMQGVQGGNQTVYIPVNQLGVTSVWAMDNDLNGVAGVKDAWIAFDFGSSADATTSLTTLVVKLMDTPNSSTASSLGILQNSLACTPTCSTGGSNYSNGDNGPMAATTTVGSGVTGEAQLTATNAGLSTTGSTATGDVSVYTNNLYDFAYTSGGAGGGGNAVLNDLGFVFSTSFLSSVAGDYLVDVRLYDNGGTQLSSNALSALTVLTSPAPEPSTWLLLIAGVASFGAYKFRRRSA